MKNTKRASGFTLIEVIAVLLLAGILATSAVVSLAPVAQGLAQVRSNAEVAHKARLAMSRLSREFIVVTNFAITGTSTINYRFLTPSGASWFETREHTVSWAGSDGDPLLLEGQPLIDHVRDFRVTAVAADPLAIDVMMVVSNVAGDDTYALRVVPRNIPDEVTP